MENQPLNFGSNNSEANLEPRKVHQQEELWMGDLIVEGRVRIDFIDAVWS